jgi:arabinofuranan 3-O-arabinosyltransferase
VADAGDAEQTMSRDFQVPARRRFTATAWVAPFAAAPDPALDRLAGYRGPVVAASSDRADGEPRWRASQALDGDPGTAWMGSIVDGHTPWLSWQTPRPSTIRALRLLAPATPVARPTQVRLTWPGGGTPVLPVDASGRVALPRAVSARRFELTVLTAAAPAGASAPDRSAVGIAEVRGVRGLPPIRATGFRGAPCGAVRVRVGGAVVPLRVTGAAAAFAQGRPLAARSCGAPVTLAAGAQHLQVLSGTFAVDDLRLQSPAPAPVATAAVLPGRVLSAGTAGRGAYLGVRVAVRGPAWLVLGEGYNRGWSATCNGRSLGAPVPIDGYANGWRIGLGCTAVAFTFAPQRLATIGYIVSGAAAVICLLLLMLGGWRRRDVAPDRPKVHLPPGRSAPVREPSIVWALPAAVVFGFVFGIDAGVVAAAAIALVLWRGIGAGPLALAAGALLGIVVPVLYLLHPGSSAGGNHYGYATGHLGAHWVGVAAIGMLMAALWRTLRSP